jgi:hypothetical protein
MNNISTLISILSSEEKKQFVLKLKRKNKRNDVKNIELFYLLEKNEHGSNLDVAIYGKPSKGAYHALCKRLYDTLVEFISLKSFHEEASDEISILKLIMVSKILFEKKQEELAFKILTKAEIKAVKYATYHFLNDVYNIQIQFVHLHPTLVLNELIEKYEKNRKLLDVEEHMNLFYASVQNELNSSNLEVGNVINRKLKEFNITVNEKLTYQSLYKILEISNKVANVSRDYHESLHFIESTYKQIRVSEEVKNKDLNYHIQVLYYMANTYFRIKNFEKSRDYLNKMQDAMKLQNNKYKGVFTPQYDLVDNLLLMFSGELEHSVEKLNNYEFKKNIKELEYYHDLKLTHVVALFFTNSIKESYRVLNEFHHSDTWYTSKSGIIWVIKKNLIELLLLVELDYLDLVESRIKSFRKKYRGHLLAHDELKILEFVKLVNQYYNDPKIVAEKKFMKRVDSLLVKSTEIEDIFTISFFAWLESKIKNRAVYPVCLEYVTI